MARIIRRTGLIPWPKLFQNMRLTRATELAAEFPAHVCTAWMGHAKRVAEEHYWRTTEDDFQRAMGWSASTEKAAGKTAEQAAASACTDSQTKKGNPRKPRELPLFAAPCEAVRITAVEDRGLEPLTS